MTLVDVINGCDKLVGQLTNIISRSSQILGHAHLVHSILKLCQYVTHGYDVMECEVVVGLEVVEHANALQG